MVGDTWQWTKVYADYPTSESWALSYALTGPATVAAISASISGDHYAVSLAAATTAAYTPGTYQWRAFLTKASERHQVGAGVFVLQPDLAVKTGDQRSHAVKMLTLIESALEGRILTQEEEYSLSGRSMKKLTIPELQKLRGRYLLEVRREQSGGALPMRAIAYRFTEPTA